MSEVKQDERTANFTSSKISDLTTGGTRPMTPEEKKVFQEAGGDKRKKNCFDYGKPFYSYIKTKRRERAVGRSLDNEARANSLDWGNLCEKISHEDPKLLGLEYELVSKTRYKHKSLPWSGMPDEIVRTKKPKVSDIKCPFTLISFLDIYEAIDEADKKEYAEILKAVKPEWYWQLISNSILTDINTCELILFMPKRSRLEEIRKASEFSGKYYFHNKSDFELPWTADNSDIPEITKITFEAPGEDKKHLIERVTLATELLNK